MWYKIMLYRGLSEKNTNILNKEIIKTKFLNIYSKALVFLVKFNFF
jgi:hypothetical protein